MGTLIVVIGILGSVAAVVSAVCDVISARHGGEGTVESQSRLSLRRTYIVVASFLLLTWGAVAFDYYDRHFSSWDITKDVGIIKSWGEVPHKKGEPYQLQVTADGRRLISYRGNYRLAAMCFYADGTKDYLDITRLQKSALYDIQNNDMLIVFAADDEFVEERKRMEGRAANYFLFLVPKGVEMGHFSTIRQAQALGVIQLSGGSGVFKFPKELGGIQLLGGVG